ncbi:MAG: MBL fold metallo-hydrolase [Desulfobacteraceae bacterium]|jgi:L-ascorbate metabolism protein UlaG (beta-lactamase superfamily)
MGKSLILVGLFLGSFSFVTVAGGFETDTIKTSAGKLEITFIGHGTLIFSFEGRVIHVDPWTRLADYSKMPKAHIILITHQHRDHLDLRALEFVRTEQTALVLTEICAGKVKGGIVMHNGDVKTVGGLKIEAVPAYNLVHMRSPGVPYHPKGQGNGYVITFGDKRVYVAGDTENTPEMKALKDIDVAFLPMNLPYTMTPEMVADAARAFKPKVLYPYHFGQTDTSELVKQLKDVKEVEVRIRKMK